MNSFPAVWSLTCNTQNHFYHEINDLRHLRMFNISTVNYTFKWKYSKVAKHVTNNLRGHYMYLWMAEKVHLFVCNELNRIQKKHNTWNTNSIIFVQYFTFLAVKQLNKYPRPAIYSREPPAKLLWIRIRQSIVRLLHVLPYLRGPLQTSTYKLCIYQRSYVSYR